MLLTIYWLMYNLFSFIGIVFYIYRCIVSEAATTWLCGPQPRTWSTNSRGARLRIVYYERLLFYIYFKNVRYICQRKTCWYILRIFYFNISNISKKYMLIETIHTKINYVFFHKNISMYLHRHRSVRTLTSRTCKPWYYRNIDTLNLKSDIS